VINLILCGGSGTRLWPLSRKLMPKQFIKLFDDKSLFQLTALRNSSICKKTMIITNNEHYFLAYDQLEELDNKEFNLNECKFLLEPVGKNTAPAIALACMEADENSIIFVTPSDHLIKDNERYINAVKKAKEFANEGYLVTFGIKPTYPESGYGYIESKGFDVLKFHEKPDIKTAENYLEKGNFYWNSGMFMFKAGVFLKELKKHSPEIYEKTLQAYNNKKEHNNSYSQIRIPFKYMDEIPEESVDYAVMEKSDKIKIVPSEFEWNDLGSFDSLIKEIDSDDGIEVESENNFIYSDRTVAMVDVNDLIVIDTKDAILISKQGSSQKVKEVVNKLKREKPELLNAHTKVHRPWGTYETLIEDDGYKIKRIIVKPGKRLSLQKHFHRSEHWIVVSGTAEVTIGEKTFLVRPNESTYIKMGEVHRLSNPGKIPVVLIEAQVGEYTGEDDIVRLEDDFKRHEKD